MKISRYPLHFKGFSFLVAILVSLSVNAQNPLSSFSKLWTDSMYKTANTAASASFLSSEEKKVIAILNLARMNPELFANTVVSNYDSPPGYKTVRGSDFYKGLIEDLLDTDPLPLIYPSKKSYDIALCHAITSGKAGYTGHKRQSKSCPKFINAECCSYGFSDAFNIVMQLLIDDGIENLGHRDICLGNYTRVGVSIQNHKSFRYNCVLDFEN